jgi:hypothetical protein
MKYEKGSAGVLTERREKTLKAGKPKKVMRLKYASDSVNMMNTLKL